MARTLPFLAASLGAVLLVPLAPGPASAAPVTSQSAGCPAHDLSDDQLAELLHDVDTATAAKAKAARGLRTVIKVTDPSGDSLKAIQVLDLTRDRAEITFAISGLPTDRAKALSNGYSYNLATTGTGKADKAALGVIHRSSIWVNQGRTDSSDTEVPTFSDVEADSATCVETTSGATITTTGDDALTLKVNTSLAAIALTQKPYDNTLSLTLTYEAQYVTDIPGKNRISSASWNRANDSAEQRASVLAWAHTTADKAKSLAKKAGHTVRASDIQAAARKWPLDRTLRSNLRTGVLVTVKDRDPYTGKQLQVKLTASDRTVKIAHNW